MPVAGAKLSTPARRMGPRGSEGWVAILDGAEDVLREEGYAALTSRNIAERIDVKQRLVYYYFRTMDEVIVETFRRLAAREMDRLIKALAGKRPLKDLWAICIETADTRLVSEFMALANRNAPLRNEVKAFIEKSRKIQVAALADAMAREGRDRDLPAVAASIFATSAALLLHREDALGVRMGHAEIRAVIERFIDTLAGDVKSGRKK